MPKEKIDLPQFVRDWLSLRKIEPLDSSSLNFEAYFLDETGKAKGYRIDFLDMAKEKFSIDIIVTTSNGRKQIYVRERS